MKEPQPLTAEQISALASQTFNLQQPGRLLRDFSVLLDFINYKGGIEVSPKTHKFALKLLPELNQLMTYPLDIKINRPVQKTFPHLDALHLLLRASGLASVETKGSKHKLMLNKAIVESWDTLNDTERYFALLNAWCYRGFSEHIMSIYRQEERNFFSAVEFVDRLKENDDTLLIKNKNDVYLLNFLPSLLIVALMELFGFVDVNYCEPIADEHWGIASIKMTRWGNLIFNYEQRIDNHPTVWFFVKLYDLLAPWETEFKAYIPQWQNELPDLNPEVVTTGTYVFKVSLGDVYRKLAVPATALLDDLAMAILKAFKFDNDHGYEFIYQDFYDVTETIARRNDNSDDELCTASATVGYLPLRPKTSFIFHFDFGDNWQFHLDVESIDLSATANKIKVIETEGKPPKQYPNDDDWF